MLHNSLARDIKTGHNRRAIVLLLKMRIIRRRIIRRRIIRLRIIKMRGSGFT